MYLLVLYLYELQVLLCLEDMLLLFPAKKHVRGKRMHEVCLPKEEVPQELSSSRKTTGIQDPALLKQGR